MVWIKSSSELNGGVLFGDELAQAPTSMQNVARQLVNEGRVGQWHLPKGWHVVTAGNRLSDKAGVNRLPSHMKDCLTYFNVEGDVEDTCNYFVDIGVDFKVIAYLRANQDFYCKNDLEKSIKYTKVYQQQNTRNPFAYEMLGSLNFLNGNYIEAVKNFTESLKKNDELKIVPSPILKFSIANALIKIDNKDSLRKALTILEQLIPIKNKSIRLWRLIGVTSHKLKMKSISMVAQAEEKILKKQYKKAKKIASKALQDNNIKSLYKIRALDIINLN